jgi:hypothetical protein
MWVLLPAGLLFLYKVAWNLSDICKYFFLNGDILSQNLKHFFRVLRLYCSKDIKFLLTCYYSIQKFGLPPKNPLF